MKFSPVIIVTQLINMVHKFVTEHIGHLSAHTLGWITIVLLHFASFPTLLSVLLAQNDKLPPFDLMVFVWAALTTLFFKSLIEKNFLYVSTICVGFIAQVIMLGMIVFK
jgi:hypothetical protein